MVKVVKEEWTVVKFGDKEFLMPIDVSERFTGKIYANSHFYLYFDGYDVFTDDKLHIPAGNNREIKEYRFIVVYENTEFWKPENFILLAKENGLSLYTVNHDVGILYRNGNEYTIMFEYGKNGRIFYKQKAIFEAEKPLNEETFNLIKRLHKEQDKTKLVKMEDEEIGFFEVEIIDYDDVKVYTSDDEHRLIALENAEIVRLIKYVEEYKEEKLIAIKGNKTYLATEQVYFQTEGSYIKFDGDTRYYINKYRFYEYIPDEINVIRKDKHKSIVEIPSLDSEIMVRKLITKAKPEIIDTYPPTLHCNFSEPKLIEEKTFKVKDLVNKSVTLYYWDLW